MADDVLNPEPIEPEPLPVTEGDEEIPTELPNADPGHPGKKT